MNNKFNALDRDMDKSEAQALANLLNSVSVEAKVSNAAGRWVVMGILPNSEAKFVINDFGQYNSIRWLLNNAASIAILNAIKNK